MSSYRTHSLLQRILQLTIIINSISAYLELSNRHVPSSPPLQQTLYYWSSVIACNSWNLPALFSYFHLHVQYFFFFFFFSIETSHYFHLLQGTVLNVVSRSGMHGTQNMLTPSALTVSHEPWAWWLRLPAVLPANGNPLFVFERRDGWDDGFLALYCTFSVYNR